MRGRLGMMIGFGAGYVLGAKAGKERYEQLRRLYENVMDQPAVRQATGRAKSAVGSGLEQAKDMASDGVSKAVGAVKDRGAADARSGLTVAPPPDYSG